MKYLEKEIKKYFDELNIENSDGREVDFVLLENGLLVFDAFDKKKLLFQIKFSRRLHDRCTQIAIRYYFLLVDKFERLGFVVTPESEIYLYKNTIQQFLYYRNSQLLKLKFNEKGI